MKYKLVKNIEELKMVYLNVDPFFEGLNYPILLILADNDGVIVIDNKDLITIENERQSITASVSE